MKPKIAVPRPKEIADLHEIVQLLLADCGEHFVNINATDVRAIYEDFKRVRDGGEDVVFEDLFGEPYYLTAVGVQHVISVHRGFARHVPARSTFFDIVGADQLPSA